MKKYQLHYVFEKGKYKINDCIDLYFTTKKYSYTELESSLKHILLEFHKNLFKKFNKTFKVPNQLLYVIDTYLSITMFKIYNSIFNKEEEFPDYILYNIDYNDNEYILKFNLFDKSYDI